MYNHLLAHICDEYDLDLSQARAYFETSDNHLEILIGYLRSIGYDVKMFKFDGIGNTPLSWGLEFNNRCELTLALCLRYAQHEREAR